MPRPLQLTIFLLIIISLTFGLHYYVWVHLVRDPQLPPLMQKFATVLLGSLGIILVLTMPLSRFVPRAWATPVSWIGFTWMGCILFLCLILSGIDLFRFGVFKLHGAPNPERRIFLERLLALGALGAGALVSTAAFLQATRRIKIKNLPIFLQKLPSHLSGFRIVQLTDLHIGPTLGQEWLTEIVQKTNQLAPDLIVITGDLVDGSVHQLSDQVAPLAQLSARHGIFFVTGNHEYYSGADEWIAELRRMGIQVLRNERVSIAETDTKGFYLVGIDDYHSGEFPGHGPNLPGALMHQDPDRLKILLAHQPAAIEEAANFGIDLQLSGHTHGGQFWPWHYFVRLQQPYLSGLHQHKTTETQIYISPGTGYWGPPMRLGTAAEITHITLFPKTKV